MTKSTSNTPKWFLAEKDGRLETFPAELKDIMLKQGFTFVKDLKQPSVYTMQKWLDNGVARATDGCKVEPDGTCEHNCPSWLIKLGLI